MNNVHFLRTRGVQAQRAPEMKELGFRLVFTHQVLSARYWKTLDLAIEAAKYAAAEAAGMTSLAGIMEPVVVHIEKVQAIEDSLSPMCVAHVTYRAGSYLPQVKILSQKFHA